MATRKEGLDQNDVVSLAKAEDKLRMPNSTFKVSEFCQSALKQTITQGGQLERWEQGVEAEVLTTSKGWRKGKVKLSMEFIPDEPESLLLDDIRKSMGLAE